MTTKIVIVNMGPEELHVSGSATPGFDIYLGVNESTCLNVWTLGDLHAPKGNEITIKELGPSKSI